METSAVSPATGHAFVLDGPRCAFYTGPWSGPSARPSLPAVLAEATQLAARVVRDRPQRRLQDVALLMSWCPRISLGEAMELVYTTRPAKPGEARAPAVTQAVHVGLRLLDEGQHPIAVCSALRESLTDSEARQLLVAGGAVARPVTLTARPRSKGPLETEGLDRLISRLIREERIPFDDAERRAIASIRRERESSVA